MGTKVLKWAIVALLLANIGFIAYNCTLMIERFDFGKDREAVHDMVARVRIQRQSLKDEIARIRRQNIVAVDHVNVYFAEKAQACALHPESQLQITNRSDKVTSGKFEEERWKIGFNTKDHVFSLKTIAAYCQTIETGSPQFQIREIDLGKRSEIWGKDEWKPNSLVVRRITLRSSDSRGRN